MSALPPAQTETTQHDGWPPRGNAISRWLTGALFKDFERETHRFEIRVTTGPRKLPYTHGVLFEYDFERKQRMLERASAVAAVEAHRSPFGLLPPWGCWHLFEIRRLEKGLRPYRATEEALSDASQAHDGRLIEAENARHATEILLRLHAETFAHLERRQLGAAAVLAALAAIVVTVGPCRKQATPWQEAPRRTEYRADDRAGGTWSASGEFELPVHPEPDPGAGSTPRSVPAVADSSNSPRRDSGGGE